MNKVKKATKKLTAIALSIVMMLVLLVSAVSPQAEASTDITASFTDRNFMAAVRGLNAVPSSGTILTSHIAGITELDVSAREIQSLAGIEHFVALEKLDVSDNRLTTLDVSNNKALKRLFVNNNQLASLNVSNNKALTELQAWDNRLTVLDVSDNVALTGLSISDNKLTTLNVSNNNALEWLFASGNELTALNVSNNTRLISLLICDNQLTTLDVSNNAVLIELSAMDNRLTTLNLRANVALRWLDVRYNSIPSLDMVMGIGNTRLPMVNTRIIEENIEFSFRPQNFPPKAWQTPTAINRFSDVPNYPHWQNDPVSWASSNGITQGVASSHPPEFRPNDYLTREMFATFIHRIDGQHTAGATNFSDARAISSWAVGAVSWTAHAGVSVIQGFDNNTFRPQRNISREQVAVMLFRYAEFVEADTTFSTTAFREFPDTGRVSSWAVEAMQWATYHGLIAGQRGNLAPQSNATRAEAVTMLYRFVNILEIPAP